jgi:hypothetical protein
MQQDKHTKHRIFESRDSAERTRNRNSWILALLIPIHSLNHIPNEKTHDTINVNAEMYCKMAVSIDAAIQLVQQLNQFLKRIAAQMPVDRQKTSDQANKIVPGAIPPDEKSSTPENSRGGLNSRGLKTH